ncbi:MAG: VanZ family protein, partial [Planctomycetaceae bacterium]
MAESWLTRLQSRVSTWTRWSGQVLLCTWWLLMFTATHIPMPSKVGDSQVPDKLIHFLMFLGLGFLLPLWRGWSSALTWRRRLALFGIVTLYAIADELLQIPVGRTAEWLDGAADLAGG